MKPLVIALGFMLAGASLCEASEASAELTRKHLYAGSLSAGDAELAQIVAATPGDAEARFGLGLVRLVRALERLGQGLHRYGLHAPRSFSVPILRFPVPENPQPEMLSYAAFRSLLTDFEADLATAEASLAAVGEAPATLRIDLTKVTLDLTGTGRREGATSILALIEALPGVARPVEGTSFMVKFNSGDAAWFAGYANALMAFDDFLLAYDFSTTFDVGFHLVFPRTTSPIAEALRRPVPEGRPPSFADPTLIADTVEIIHSIDWPVAEPQRLGTVRERLKRVFAMSRLSWKLILAETGDEREWLPNPRQKDGVFGVTVSQAQIDAWLAALDEAEAILDGRRLVPHWRFAKGVDARRFFEEPRRFALVSLIAGAGAVPLLTDGPITIPEHWAEINQVFNGNLFGYAFWFN